MHNSWPPWFNIHNLLTPNLPTANYCLRNKIIILLLWGFLTSAVPPPLTQSLDSHSLNIICKFHAYAPAVLFTWKILLIMFSGGAYLVVKVVNTVFINDNHPPTTVGQCTTSATFQRWLVSIPFHFEGQTVSQNNSIVSQLCLSFRHHQFDTFSLENNQEKSYNIWSTNSALNSTYSKKMLANDDRISQERQIVGNP